MPSDTRSGAHLGRLALDMGFLTEAQLQEAERAHEQGGKTKGIVAILLEKGHLTGAQVTQVLFAQRRESTAGEALPRDLDVTRVDRRGSRPIVSGQPAGPTQDDLALARAAVEMKFVEQARVDECLGHVQDGHGPLPLSIVLQERGYLDAEDLALLNEELRRRSEAPGGPRKRFVMEVLSGEDEGRAFPLVEYAANVIGRGVYATVKLSDPLVSREQCLLDVEGETVRISHLRGRNTTYVNEHALLAPVELRAGDLVRAGNTVFSVTAIGEGQRAAVQVLVPGEEKGVRVECRALSKQVTSRDTGKPLLLLDGIDLVVNPGEFVVILGPSGSGKSTLMDALNGRRRATAGRVSYDGIDLYGGFDLFKTLMGYVPQRDIVHSQLSVRRALYYTAKLRLPPTASGAEVDRTIDGILAQMGLEARAQTRIGNLSGGQVKRVSLGVELVSSPSILFLDEATSGLDAGTERKMMNLFRQVADQGKTVVCITHNIENIHQADLVIVVFRGKLVWYGKPDALLEHFDIPSVADLYDRLEAGDAQAWHERYAASDACATFVRNRLGRAEAAAAPAEGASRAVNWALKRKEDRRRESANAALEARLRSVERSETHQFFYLAMRYLETTVRDTRNMTLLLLQAPLIALVISFVFSDRMPLLLFLMTISAIWFGCLNACKEIVKEAEIYKRERMVNLRLLPYVMSKLVLLVGISAIQCFALLAIIRARSDLGGPFWAEYVTLLNAAVGGLLMGLVISALVDSTDKALAIVPLVLIPQIVFTVNSAIGAPMSAVNKTVAQLVIMSFWAFDALRSAEIVDVVRPYGVNLWKDIALGNGVLLAMELALFAGTLVALWRKDRDLVQ